ncbi:unnamed protein product [Lactuca saligna]|uniref:Reverse transcriptase zinc-binding domain-containing protein n=1 Tax=Lactuca saligna TaxID=75948 RepID=A0AA36EF66_LACSI|nr:unnamed protein product [Lactuca saligna]
MRNIRGGREESDLQELSNLLACVKILDRIDRFWWPLDLDGIFSVKLTRNFIDNVNLHDRVETTRWCKILPIRVNIFLWRAAQDRLPTRFTLSERGMDLSFILCAVCNVDVASIKEWLSWVDDQRGRRRHRLEVIVITMLWMLWRFRNSITFDGDKIKKSLLFDNVVLLSFSWLKNRDSNSGVVWNSWLMYSL